MVLVVDDEPSIAQAMKAVLEMNGYSVVTASSCDEALAAIDENPPNLVLSDINMPHHSGLELLATMKANEQTGRIPLVFVSAMGRAQDVKCGMDAGAAGYLVKPFNPVMLMETVRQFTPAS